MMNNKLCQEAGLSDRLREECEAVWPDSVRKSRAEEEDD